MSNVMEEKSWVFFRVLLNHFHEGSAEAFLKHLPQEDVKRILSQNVLSSDPAAALKSPTDFLARIHYSWLLKPFKELSPDMQSFVLSSLTKEQAQGLCKFLGVPFKPLPIKNCFNEYFLNEFCRHLQLDKLTPLAYLPETSLTPLGRCSKQELVELIDFLGLFDLAGEIRQIVDKKLLEQIYTCLSKKKQLYLRTTLHQIDKLNTPKLGLDALNGDCKKIEIVLHRRGLIRLALALVPLHPDFVWYIHRILDTGRSNLLKKYANKDENPNIVSSVTTQVVNTFNFLKLNPL